MNSDTETMEEKLETQQDALVDKGYYWVKSFSTSEWEIGMWNKDDHHFHFSDGSFMLFKFVVEVDTKQIKRDN